MTRTQSMICQQPSQHCVEVTDIHSKQSRASISDYRLICDKQDIVSALNHALQSGMPVATCGGRHAMGGQQFASEGLLLDMSGMSRVLGFDADSGQVIAEAGIQWPALVKQLLQLQTGQVRQWSIRQKQTGADRLSLGGALAANIHGRVLDNRPIIEDVVSFRLITADGRRIECSRRHNSDLFSLVIGGYGLFGVVTDITLQLVPRQKLQRVVTLAHVSELEDAFASRITDGYVYGDLQFRIDADAGGFLDEGIFSCYRPVVIDTPIPDGQRYMTEQGWQDLLYLAHTDKSRAFEAFSEFYLATSGQLYWSDLHQFTTYLDDYHTELDARLCCEQKGSEMITELYVPLEDLDAFMHEARRVMRNTAADIIYGTIRLIRQDTESYLAWARQDYACIIFNLHVEHSQQGIDSSRITFRKLIDVALSYGGSFFLTYHRHASRQQIESAYPRFGSFLRQKRLHDPDNLLCSDWYRHVSALFGE